MGIRITAVICFIGCAVSVPQPGTAATLEKRSHSVFEGVKQLAKPVTYTETKIPLGELVRKVANDAGVSLTATKDVADVPVAVAVKELPARELLEQLADLLDYQWNRKRPPTADHRPPTSGETARRGQPDATPVPTPNTQHPTPAFEIGQDLAARQREEALRQRVLGAIQNELRAEVRRYLEIAVLPPARIQGILDAGRQHQQELDRLPAEEKQRLLRSPGERERKRRHDAALKLTSPIARALATLLGRLPSQQWEALQRERTLYFSTEPAPGEQLLPPEIARVFRTSQPTMYLPSLPVTFANAAQEERLRKQEKEGQDLWAAATGYRVKAWLDDRAFRMRGMLILTLNAMPLRGGVPDQADRFDHSGLSTARLFLYAAPDQAAQDAAEGEAAPEFGLDKDPVLGTAKPFKPEAKPRPRLSGSGQIRLRLRDLLQDLARTYGVQIIGDAYWSAPALSAQQLSRGETIPLHRLLDRLSAPSHRSVRRGALIHLRSRTWFFDRPREVPLRLIRRWSGLHAQRGGLPLGEYLSMVSTLNEEQLRSLPDLDYEGELPPHVDRACFAREVLRLYASLAPAARQALWEGRSIDVEHMTRPQRQLFLAAVSSPDRYRSKPLDLRQWAAGSLSLARQRFVVLQGEGQAFIVPVDAEGKPNARMLEAMRRMVTSGPVPTLGPGPTRPLTSLRFLLQYGSERPEEHSVNVVEP